MITIKNTLNQYLVKSGLINKIIGISTGIIHLIIISIITFIGVFSFNINTLSITFVIVSLILIGNIILHDCPLSNIEEQRLGDCFVDKINQYFPINYDKTRRYEVQLQYIFIISSIIGLKILFYFFQKDLKNIIELKYT